MNALRVCDCARLGVHPSSSCSLLTLPLNTHTVGKWRFVNPGAAPTLHNEFASESNEHYFLLSITTLCSQSRSPLSHSYSSLQDSMKVLVSISAMMIGLLAIGSIVSKAWSTLRASTKTMYFSAFRSKLLKMHKQKVPKILG